MEAALELGKSLVSFSRLTLFLCGHGLEEPEASHVGWCGAGRQGWKKWYQAPEPACAVAPLANERYPEKWKWEMYFMQRVQRAGSWWL